MTDRKEGDEGPTTEEELQEIEQNLYAGYDQVEKEATQIIHYNPEPLKTEELITDRVGTAVGKAGIVSVMQQAMGRLGRREQLDWESDGALARRLVKGEVVRFKDTAERKRVIDLAEQYASNTANKIQAKRGEWVEKEDVGFVSVGGKAREMLTGMAMRGHYDSIAPVPYESPNIKEKTMAHLRKSVQLNETYSPSQGASMLSFIEKMWVKQPLRQ